MQFILKIDIPRKRYRRSFFLTKTKGGWICAHLGDRAPCEPDCQPALSDQLGKYEIKWPVGTAYKFDSVWNELDTGSISKEEAQVKLQEIADTI
jgi:hypothetical protein